MDNYRTCEKNIWKFDIQNIDFLKKLNCKQSMNNQLYRVNNQLKQNQQSYIFLLPTFPTSNHLVSHIFSTHQVHPTQFYMKLGMSDMQKESLKTNEHPPNQDYERNLQEDNLTGSLKIIKEKNDDKKIQEYDPKEKQGKAKNKKTYQKDKQRNILPNAISKLFFFLKSMSKSQKLLTNILTNQPILGQNINSSKYYSYHSLIKSKMTRFMTEESLNQLFVFQDPQFTLFSKKEQLCMMKINAIMVRCFIKNKLYLHSILNSYRGHRNKIEAYIKKYRVIEEKINQYIEQAKYKYNFSQNNQITN